MSTSTVTDSPEQQSTTEGGRPVVDRLFQRIQQGITLETLLFLLILAIAIATRFWDLGGRALHHDESLHTFYSWRYSEGDGYDHHPMMHGPFLFHANAFLYLLFGSTDYVSRMMPALFGVILVMMPWLLRGKQFLGRWGALVASFLILVSPSMLYFSRFLRHDPYAVAGAFLMVIAILRYMEKPERRWVITFFVTLGVVLTTHEIIFANIFIMVTFLAFFIILRIRPAIFAAALGGILFLGLLLLGLTQFSVGSIPEIPWESPSPTQVIRYLVSLLGHPYIIAALGSLTLIVMTSLWLIDMKRDRSMNVIDGVLGDAPDQTTAAAFRNILRERRGLAIGAGLGALFFTVLFTSIFSNLGGMGSGTLGSLGYWLAQHDVQRGAQPWFYYILLTPQYELIAALFMPIVAGWLIWYAVRNRTRDLERDLPFFTILFISYWAVVMFMVLSWAGEKMPWLIIHTLVPMLVVCGALIGRAIEWLFEIHTSRIVPSRNAIIVAISGILLTAASWFLLVGWGSGGPYVETDGDYSRILRPEIADYWYIVHLPALALLVTVGIIIIKFGVSAGIRVTTLGIVTVLMFGQLHVGWDFAYRTGDVPRDMLVYVQTSPDVKTLAQNLETMSQELTGGMDMEVVYDNRTQWPLNWYLHNFNNRRLIGLDMESAPTAPVVLLSSEFEYSENEEHLEDYSYVEYPLRWWITEGATYRRFAIAPELNDPGRQNYQTDQEPPYSLGDVAASVWNSVSSIQEPEQQGSLFRFVAYREFETPLGSHLANIRVYIHDDYRQYYDNLRYGQPSPN